MVEAKIFILYGAANKGKSTTLNTLFNQICRKFSKFLGRVPNLNKPKRALF